MGLLNFKSWWERGEIRIFVLAEMQNGTGTIENSMETPKKTYKKNYYRPSSPDSVYTLKNSK